MTTEIKGISKHRFYKKWIRVVYRCHNKKSGAYENYGGRGITVSKEFRDSRTFLEYLDSLPGYGVNGRITLDRIRNNEGYKRGNLRWATMTEQKHNQRPLGKNNTSGYTGVMLHYGKIKWVAFIYIKNKYTWIAIQKDKHDAARKRNEYIIKNNLPHKIQEIKQLSPLTKEKGETT